ncbi:MAG: hypothetical protein HC770_09245 [Pseudanabaena sp. CRU_2_10]|nr:hypothetical protein [Pseudanabaena sp. CRU_2_10]
MPKLNRRVAIFCVSFLTFSFLTANPLAIWADRRSLPFRATSTAPINLKSDNKAGQSTAQFQAHETSVLSVSF